MKKINILAILIIALVVGTTASASWFTDLFNRNQTNLGATVLFPYQGGTGTGTAPTYGKILIGNSGGTYTLTATSTLGITAVMGALDDLSDVVITGTDYGKLLMFNGFNWVNQATSTLGITATQIYPGSGIALSTGSAWDTSITNNSGNWNTAYGWGNHASAGYLLSVNAFTQAIASTTFVDRAAWTSIDNYPTGCTNQFVRTIGDTLTCASVANTDLTNSTIGLTSTGSITVGTSPISLGGTSALNLNMGYANTWTALQTFANASTTGIATVNELCFSNGECMNTPVTEGSNIELFPNNLAVDIATYESLRTEPLTSAEVDETCAATSGYCAAAIDNYISTTTLSATGPLVLNKLPAGTWNFDVYTYVNLATGITYLEYNILRRTSAGVETQLFQATSTEINNNTVGINSVNTVQPAFAFDPTDRLVLRVKGWTDSVVAKTVHLVYGGMSHYSHVGTPATIASQAVAFLPADNIFTGINTFNGKTNMGYASTTQLTTTGSTYLATTGGNVGIGTTGPLKNLDVYHATVAPVIMARAPSGVAAYVSAVANGNTQGTNSFDLIQNSNNDAYLYQRANAPLYIGTNNATVMTLLASGNVGIGTTSPVSKLAVLGESAFAGGASVGIGYAGTAAPVGGMIIQGNVGIGTTGPNQKLSVNGNVEIQGAVGTTRFIITDETNTGTGKLAMQAGGGSPGYGGAINLFSHSHATKPGWVTAGLSAGAGSGATEARFTVNDQGLAGGTDVFTVLGTGNVGIGTTSPAFKLDVYGTLRAGASQFDGTVVTVNITATGVIDMGGATSFELPNGASPTVDTDGECAIDTTSGQLVCDLGATVAVIGNGFIYPAFSYATSTTMTGTTTRAVGTAFVAETWSGVQCYTNVGTMDVQFGDGTNWMNFVAGASTTVGTITLSTNNTFTAGEKRYVRFGNPATAPTEISCTAKKTQTQD